jgi:uncharacterized protein YjbI with pentapeptide repeats
MHSRSRDKDLAAFGEEIEHILKQAGSGIADFTQFVFVGAVNYAGRRFEAICAFKSAVFNDAVDFTQTTFMQSADFTGAEFSQDADFTGATFEQDAEFAGSKFRSNVNFDRVAFKRAAIFSGCVVERDASFSTVGFSGNTSFLGATFSRNALFHGATFSQDANFSYGRFARCLIFTEAKFLGSVEFRATQFREDAELLPGPVFTRAEFLGPKATLFYRTYLGQALLYDCEISRFAFSTVRWRERPANGKSMVFEEVIDLAVEPAIDLRSGQGHPDERNYVLIAELYQRLKKAYDDRKDYWTAGDFHYGEMEMQRLASPKLTWLDWLGLKLGKAKHLTWLGSGCGKLRSSPLIVNTVRWWHQKAGLAAWYRRASDYGESLGKPLLWFVATICLFTISYPFMGLRPPKDALSNPITAPSSVAGSNVKYWKCSSRVGLLGHSLMTTISVAAFQRDLAYEPIYPWGRLLVFLEQLLTSTLIALFLLALRRQFQR